MYMRVRLIVPYFFLHIFMRITFSIHESLKLFSNKKIEIFVSTTQLMEAQGSK